MTTFAKMLPTLADEISLLLPVLLGQYPEGPLASDVARCIGANVPSVRRAFEALEADGRAKIVRRKRALHLVSPDYPGRTCIICRIEFNPVRKETKACSHSCARHLAWQNADMRARHQASVKAAKSDPALREHFSKINKERCSTPEWRAKMSDQNRRSWKDPESRAKRLVAIEAAWRGENAIQRITKAREKKLALWSDPVWASRTRDAMRNGTRGRVKRAVIALVLGDANIEAQEIAARVGLTVQKVKIIWRRAARQHEVNRSPKDGRKTAQSTEVIRNRVAKTRMKRAKSAHAEAVA